MKLPERSSDSSALMDAFESSIAHHFGAVDGEKNPHNQVEASSYCKRIAGFHLLPKEIRQFFHISDQWQFMTDCPQDHLVDPPCIFPEGTDGIPPGEENICFLSENQGVWVVSASPVDGRCFVSSDDYSKWLPITASPSLLLVTYALMEMTFCNTTIWHDNARQFGNSPHSFGGLWQSEAKALIRESGTQPRKIFTGLFEPWAVSDPKFFSPEEPEFWFHEDTSILIKGNPEEWDGATILGKRVPRRRPNKRMESNG